MTNDQILGLRIYYTQFVGIYDSVLKELFSPIFRVFEKKIWLYGDTSIFHSNGDSLADAIIELMVGKKYANGVVLSKLANNIASDGFLDTVIIDLNDEEILGEQVNNLNALYYDGLAFETYTDYLEEYFLKGARFYLSSCENLFWDIYCKAEDLEILNLLVYYHRDNENIEMYKLDSSSSTSWDDRYKKPTHDQLVKKGVFQR